jgi:hypothetical protein
VGADADGEESPLSLTQPPPTDDGVPAIWLLAAALFAVGLGGTYYYGRRQR